MSMKELEDYKKAKEALNNMFATVIESDVEDHRNVWWWINDGEINWVTTKPEGSFEEFLDTDGAEYSMYVRGYSSSICGKYLGVDMHDDDIFTFGIFDETKCLTHEYE